MLFYFGDDHDQGILSKIYIKGKQMRIVICCVSALLTSLLTACGQTGNLQLPSDQNLDKRAQYLIYKEGEQPSKQVQEKQNKASQLQADQQAAASEIIESN